MRPSNDIWFYPQKIHPEREKYFVNDINKYIREFSSISFNQHVYTKAMAEQAWKKSQMYLIHHCRQEKENVQQYYELLFCLIIRKINEGYKEDQYGCLFLLYFVYDTKPNQKQMICVTAQTLRTLTKLICPEQLEASQLIQYMIKIGAFLPAIKEGITEIGITPDGESLAIKKHQLKIEEDNKQFNTQMTEKLKLYMEEFDKYNRKKKDFNRCYNAEGKKLDTPIMDHNYEQLRNLSDVLKADGSKRFMKQVVEDFEKKTST